MTELRNTLTIRRPSGDIEVVDITERFPGGLSGDALAKVRAATLAAGRGEVLAADNAKADADKANRAANARRRQAFDDLYNEGHRDGFNPYR
jgi:hypothetical protein